jgi:arsenate reductase (thioredoxin)
MKTHSVLFICIHNSARSQNAEALLRRQCGELIAVESAGLSPGKLNPLAVAVLNEVGIDISKKGTQSVEEVLASGRTYTHVVTVCDEASAERCPTFPGRATRLHWGFKDPSEFQGSWDERLALTREVREQIQHKIEEWCVVNCNELNVHEAESA